MSATRKSSTLQTAYLDSADTFIKQLLFLHKKLAVEVTKLHSHAALERFVANNIKNRAIQHLMKDMTPKVFVANACDFLIVHLKSASEQSQNAVKAALQRAKAAAEKDVFKLSHLILKEDIVGNKTIAVDFTAETKDLFKSLVEITAAADRLKRFSNPIEDREPSSHDTSPTTSGIMRRGEPTNYGSMPPIPPGHVPQYITSMESLSGDSDRSGYGSMPTAAFFHGSGSTKSTSGGSGLSRTSVDSKSEYQQLSLIDGPKTHAPQLKLPPPPLSQDRPAKAKKATAALTLPSEPVTKTTPRPTLTPPSVMDSKKFKLHLECRRLTVDGKLTKKFMQFLSKQDDAQSGMLIAGLIDPQAGHTKDSIEAAMSQIMQQGKEKRLAHRR